MVEMAAALNVDIKRIAAGEPQLMDQMLDLFAVAFDDAASYSSRRPSREPRPRRWRSSRRGSGPNLAMRDRRMQPLRVPLAWVAVAHP